MGSPLWFERVTCASETERNDPLTPTAHNVDFGGPEQIEVIRKPDLRATDVHAEPLKCCVNPDAPTAQIFDASVPPSPDRVPFVPLDSTDTVCRLLLEKKKATSTTYRSTAMNRVGV